MTDPGTTHRRATGAAIVAWGTALPDLVVTNQDYEARLDTTDEWITERTGIKERRHGSTTAALAADAGRQALDAAGLTGADIDYLLLATCTPDYQVPSTASQVEDELGIRGGASDLNAACSGFVYGLVHAHGLIAMGMRRVLLIGAETMSRITDQDDRNTAILFGDGAGAVVIEATEAGDQLLSFDLGSDGSLRELLDAPIGGFMQMNGREVFRQAVTVMVASAKASMDAAGVTADDIALVVPHQANVRIIEAACQRLDISTDKVAMVLHSTGNTSSASIPLALVDALDGGRVRPGDLVLMIGFGAGMSWASAVLRWPDPADRRRGT
ncbi:MAG: ketoacyl-ACP synthase III [Acidimicrobiales bacterium]|nr:ketoacyl-ACP synthase III [Acidimicrobiales bacterium]